MDIAELEMSTFRSSFVVTNRNRQSRKHEARSAMKMSRRTIEFEFVIGQNGIIYGPQILNNIEIQIGKNV
jgi:hypothetical protein